MEMPCLCCCGEWFDLNDGYGSRHSDRVICKACHRIEEEIKQLEDDIEVYEEEGNKKALVKKLRKKIEELKSR